MRTYDERVEELHLRMLARRREKAAQRAGRIAAAAYAAGTAAAVLLALLIASAPVHHADAAFAGVSASIFADHALLGYIVTALLAFSLGALVTALCARLRFRADDEETQDDRTV